MAADSRLAQLPGYDTAPDVYETPDVADDSTQSTIQSSSDRQPSEPSDTTDEDDDNTARDYGVSRRRIYPERARSRFGVQSRAIETRGADLSDRVDGRRRGYKVGRRRGEEPEGLEARIARLKRELEECKIEAEERRTKGSGEDQEGGDLVEDADALSKLLAGIDLSTPPAQSRVENQPPRRSTTPGHYPVDEEPHESNTDEQTLARVSAFDARLAALETALGLSSLDAPVTGDTTPILPTLALLDQQLSTLTSASSLSALEGASARIRKLKAEASSLQQQLNTSSAAKKPSSPTSPSGAEGDDEEDEASPAMLDSSDVTKLHTLYALLPTLQSLAPTVPALIARLRSLRSVHATAARAGADLEALEQAQGRAEAEVRAWREGLERVEEAVETADKANGKNGRVVQEWVEEMKKRVEALGR